MKNQVMKGEALNVTVPSGGFVSGNGYQVGSMFGVASYTAAQGAAGVLYLHGVYTLPKTSAQAWTVGQIIYWDNTNKVCTTAAATANLKIGAATDAAANPSSTGNVRLNGSF